MLDQVVELCMNIKTAEEGQLAIADKPHNDPSSYIPFDYKRNKLYLNFKYLLKYLLFSKSWREWSSLRGFGESGDDMLSELVDSNALYDARISKRHLQVQFLKKKWIFFKLYELKNIRLNWMYWVSLAFHQYFTFFLDIFVVL